jgi:serine/threonine protein kinase
MSDERCPEEHELHECLVGKLPAEAAEDLFDHLDGCPVCRTKLQTVGDLGDTLIDWLREPWLRDEYQDEPQFQEAVARAKAIGETLASCNQADAGRKAEQDILGQLDDYQILEKLAEGGMGSVYKALHTKLDRLVALKLLPAGSLKSERAIVRFEREIQVVGQLDHPHIVRALDAREVDGTRLLVLEYIDGDDLSRLVHRNGPLPVAEACEVVRQAAVGLQYAHQHQVIHRDIKPSNLMVDQQGQVKILDLGLARFRSAESSGDMTRDGQMMGTPGYMSPEQASDTHSVDIRTDIYGLGCTLYYLLVGRAPYPGETAYQILRAHEVTPIPSLRDERDDVPEALDRVFQKMVAKTPGERHDSMT